MNKAMKIIWTSSVSSLVKEEDSFHKSLNVKRNLPLLLKEGRNCSEKENLAFNKGRSV
jgi:hypothetical protein